ncbi:DUF4373 domain-containing protein [Hymenobacter pini]|uniref:DUF4373 domain-containing protein n=1 Tax=Hymenobacter pini TaxID=2880879 RepID=UPI001CF2E3C6|nr:DUF4373 domain-containing protein [Hymenobacter pini]MCA8830303.1 DUF4373 domain-containing protein [Hymenobacter pini]
MARPKKVGLEYFPLDCQLDDKVEMLEAEHGLIGFAAYIKLLQHIYQTEAGELDMSVVFRWKTLGKQLDMSVETLQQLLETMFAIGLFDKTAFTERQVLTSNGVQKRRKRVAGLREKDRSRKAEDDVEDSPEFSAGKPLENGGKGKGKNTTVFKKESKGKRVTLSPSTPALAAERVGEGAEVELPLEGETTPPPAAEPTSTPATPGKRDKHPAELPLAERWPDQVAVLTDAERTIWEKFLAWEQDNPLSKLFRMKEPLTPGQLVALIGKHGAGPVTSVLLDMQNRPKLLTEYDSANLTAQSWLRRRQQRHTVAA